MKRLFLSILAGMLLVTGCAKPEEPGYSMDEDGMARKPYLEIDQERAKQMMETEADLVIVDVRRQDEFDAGHIPGAVCIPNETIGTEPIDALGDFAQTILVYCRSGNRSKQAAEKLGKMGYTHVYEFGGILDWTGEIVTETPKDGAIDSSDLLLQEVSHYSFQPKICSGYMEEIFGEDMREAWFHLVDAVMAGEDTFACKDQYTYDWVMGQFPDRLLPILPRLIDFAWDREHSVKDGIASFTYLVPVEEAQARIKAFGEQVEGILNSVLEDDYSDVEKALALYEYFSKTYEYDYDTYRKMYETYVDYLSSYRFFETGTGVCQEISTAYSYLLLQAGVDATIMMGEAHQWSYVRINGHHYHIDPTFVLNDKDAMSYFMMNDEQREVTGFGKDSFIIASVYTQDNPHPDYLANDDTFRPVWDGYLEAFFSAENRMLIRKSSDFGETYHVEFDYTGF